MQISWDEHKRETNLSTDGLDFHRFEALQWRSVILRPAHPSSSGQRRAKVIGLFDGDLVTGVFSGLGRGGISLISLRRASRRERQDYEQARYDNS
jgi:uncharacterized DUF497 family protein